MSRIEPTFVDRWLTGDALADDIDDFVDHWHDGEGDPGTSLAQFLGFTDLEYRLWAEKPHLLPFVLHARRVGVSLDDARDDEASFFLAARDLRAEDAEDAARWLAAPGSFPG